MIEIAVNNLAAATGARTVTGEADRVCRGCVIDSRQVEEGTIFVAFPGENVDGNDFASRAVQSGAGAVVMTREPEAELVSLAQDKGCAILLTDDPEEFLLRLAHTYRLELGCLVVGITGSIGKTTTKDVLAAVLAKRYRVWATKGNFNNLIGMPLTVLSAPADTEVLVLEMGMNHFHEIERLSQSANPNLAIVSKIGTSHIGILGSRENIARAKAEIVQGMCAAGDFLPLLVLGGEDDFTPFIRDTFAQPAGLDVMLAGVSDDDEVRARDIRVDDEGRPVFTLDFGQGETIDTMLAIPGVQSVPNAVKAAAVAYRLGVTPSRSMLPLEASRSPVTARRSSAPRAVPASSTIPITPVPNPWLLASICCARFRARGLVWRSWARWARWAMRLLACMSSWAPMPPPRSSTCWRAWVVSWPSLWPMPRA